MRAVARLGLALGLALWCGWAEAAQWLKQSTAVTVVVGPFVDSTDAVTAETGLTISQADVQLSKNGGAYAQKNDATSASHMTSGRYSVPLNATDTGTLGVLRLDIDESGALPVWATYMVVPANVYDSLIGGSDTLQADMTQVEGSDATDYIEGRTLASASYFDFSTDAVTVGTNSDKTGYSLSQAFPSNFADLAITATTGRVTVGTNADKSGYSISGTLTTLDALDTAQDAQHSTTQSAISGLNDLSAGAVNAEVDQALADYDGPTRTELASDRDAVIAKLLDYVQLLARSDAAIATDLSAALAEINANEGSGAGAYDNTTESLQAVRDRGDVAWDTATGFSTHSAADVWTSGTRTLTANTNFNDPTAAAIAAAMGDLALASHTTAGTVGKALTDILEDTGTTIPGILGTPANGDLATDIADIAGANLTITGTVNDASPTASGFAGDSGLSSTDNFYLNMTLVFTDGALQGVPRKVTGYTGSTRTFAFATAFPVAPANGDAFELVGIVE